MELLQQLLDIYKRKHPADWENWFNRMAKDLIDTGDVTRAEYIRFCAQNDIFIKPKPTPKPPSYSSGCGSSTPTRSGC